MVARVRLFLLLASFVSIAAFEGRAQAAPAPAPASTASMLEIIDRIEDARWDSTKALRKFAANADPTVRRRAVIALGRLQDRAGTAALLKALQDSSEAVRIEAAFALGQVADTTAAEALARATAASSLELRATAVSALGKIKSSRSPRLLVPFLNDPSPRIRSAAALALAALADSTTGSYVIPLLQDPDAEVRWRAAYALEKTGDSTAVWAVANALADSVAMVRAFAARTLGLLHTKKAVIPLTYPHVLADSDWHVRVNVARSLGLLHDMGAVRALGSMKDDPVWHVRAAAAEAIGELGAPLALGALLPFLKDASASVRWRAGVADLKIEKAAAMARIEPLLQEKDPAVRAHVIEGFGPAKGSAAARDRALALLAGPEPRIRAAAASALGELGDKAALNALEAALSDTDLVVASVAADALGAIQDSTSIVALSAAYQRGMQLHSADLRLSAVQSLGKMKKRPALKTLQAARTDADYRIRQSAFEGLDALLRRPPEPEKWAPLADLPRPYEGLATPGPAHATLHTARGDVVLELLWEEAPHTVANFVRLASEGFYSNRRFHRVVPNFVAQDGCPRGDGWGDPGYTIRCEINREPYLTGTVGMALSGKDTGGSQYFITLSPQPRLDGRYTVFARVISGQDVVDALEEGDAIQGIVIGD